jgi:hypothetical protein
MSFMPPEPLTSHHALADFTCGIDALDDWLKRRAVANQTSDATRTFVVCLENKIVGYYALASGSINSQSAVGNFRRNTALPLVMRYSSSN